MNHWVAVLGACAGLVGTLLLGFELWRSRQSEADVNAFRADQDEIANEVREAVVRLRGSLLTVSELVWGYLAVINLEDEEAKAGVEVSSSVDERTRRAKKEVLREWDRANDALRSSADDDHALAVIADAGRRMEQRFVSQAEESRR